MPHTPKTKESLFPAVPGVTNLDEESQHVDSFLNTIVENIPDMIFVKDAKELRFVRFNKAGEDLLGYSRSELIGKNDYDFFPQAEADFFTAKDRAVLNGRVVVDIPEETIHTRHQGIRFLHTKKIPIYDPQGHPKYLLGISEDITERKKAQEALRETYAELEKRVADRTQALLEANVTLKQEMAERQAMQETLRESETRYRSVIEALGEGIALVRADGRILACNPSAEKILGISAEELQQRTTKDPRWKILDEDGSPLPLEKYPISKTLATGQPVNNMIVGVHRPDGTVAWLLGSTRPLFREHEKEPYAVVSSFLDITQRIHDRAQLEHSLSLLTATLESTTDGILVVDTAGKISSFNQQFMRMWRIPKEILAAQADEQVLKYVLEQLKNPEAFLDKVKRLYREPQAESFDLLEFKDGRVFERYSKPQRLGDKSVGRVWSFRDITNRKQTEETLSQLAAIVKCSDDAIIGHGLQGEILSWNAGAEQMYGYTAAEVVGRPLSIMGDADRQSEFPVILEGVRLGEGVTHFETVWRKKGGKAMHVSLTISPVTDPIGRIVSGAIVARDITERKKTEQAIRDLNEGLEHQVVARTSELTAANKELEGFSYSVSHDLRAPLRAIEGFAQILSEEHAAQLDSEGQRLLHVVSQNAKRMSQLIDDLLAFARFSRKSMVKQTVDLAEIAKTVSAELRQQETARTITLVIQPLPPAPADLSMIRQVFINLISNALKYTRPVADSRIEIGCRSENGETIYYVRDNGVGFDMRYADKLFGVFQRLHTNEEFEGTGVGLAIVQRIIHKHGGRIWVDAAVHQGATFSFTLPTAKDETHG